jgi:hypothetical protein
MNLEIVSKNINRLTNKEKVTFIQTLLGISVQMTTFLARLEKSLPIPFPVEIHYMMMIALVNINSLSIENNTGEVIDFSLRTDSIKEKLIEILKQMNEIYKEELK